jgi:hypothetical protein
MVGGLNRVEKWAGPSNKTLIRRGNSNPDACKWLGKIRTLHGATRRRYTAALARYTKSGA